MENKTIEKISLRLKDHDMYCLSVIEDYLFLISDKFGIEIDNSMTELIRQGLFLAAYGIENDLFKQDEEENK